MAELVDATDSKSVELRFMSVRVGLGVPLSERRANFFYWHKCHLIYKIYKIKLHQLLNDYLQRKKI